MTSHLLSSCCLQQAGRRCAVFRCPLECADVLGRWCPTFRNITVPAPSGQSLTMQALHPAQPTTTDISIRTLFCLATAAAAVCRRPDSSNCSPGGERLLLLVRIALTGSLNCRFVLVCDSRLLTKTRDQPTRCSNFSSLLLVI